jgi:hypothetical protein
VTVIFVFGSNLAGRHGKGTALDAKQRHGAIYGQGIGLQGRSYAIPTKDGRNRAIPLADPSQTLPLSTIKRHVDTFLAFAASRPDLSFIVTPIGCGLAGYTPAQIAPMFAGAPDNCVLPRPFVTELDKMRARAQERNPP